MEYQNYRKRNLQPMRPYVEGEDMSNISVAPTDTPEVGGMIAKNPLNPDDLWYVSAAFVNSNYELVPSDSEWQDRLKQEHADLNDRLTKLQSFQYTPAFGELPQQERSLLEKQAQLMYELSVVLASRIALI